MKLLTAILAVALLAACGEQTPMPRTATPPAASGSTSAASPSTPANAGQPNAQEKKEGANPTQGQVDPKEKEQRRDFQMRGDKAGPTSAETQPKN
jgi:hypothetical protein